MVQSVSRNSSITRQTLGPDHQPLVAWQAVGDTWDKTPEQAPLRLMALKRVFKYYVRTLRAAASALQRKPSHAWQLRSVLWCRAAVRDLDFIGSAFPSGVLLLHPWLTLCSDVEDVGC